MADVSKIDRNFAIKTNIEKDDIVFYDVDETPFKIYSVDRENNPSVSYADSSLYTREPKLHLNLIFLITDNL